MGTDPRAPTVAVAGRDVTTAIRETRISAAVSAVATNLDVRAELLPLQRELIEDARRGPRGGCVAEGRDITTVVAPDADVRILLTAERAGAAGPPRADVHGTRRRGRDGGHPRPGRCAGTPTTRPSPASRSPPTASRRSTRPG